MPVTPDSRFAGLPILEVTTPDGQTRNVVALRIEQLPTDQSTTAVRVRQGDELDLLARRYLGDERLWWRILDANSLVYPLDIAPGDVISLPVAGPATTITRARSF
jgi:nucleoid-associated protein YgaU